MAKHTSEEILIGVISDTHGHLEPDLVEALEGVDMIIHAGDIDSPEIIPLLEKVAPVKAIAGNMDKNPKLHSLPRTLFFEEGGVFIYVIHDLLLLNIDLKAAGVQVLIHGHLHVPEVQERQGILFINPGSPTSPRRGSKPGFVRLKIRGRVPSAEFIALG